MSTWSSNLAGLSPVNTRDKSQAATPSAVIRDLTGCGLNDYVKVSTSANFNYRNGCDPISPLANFSLSTTIYNPGSTISNAYLQAAYSFLKEHLSNVVVDELIGDTLLLPVNSGADAIFFSATPLPFELVGNSYVQKYNNPAGGGGTVTMAVPGYKRLEECGRPVGAKISSAVTVTTLDPDTCAPRLEVAMSLSYTRYLVNKKTGARIGYVESSDFDTTFGDTRVSPTDFLGAFVGLQKDTISEGAARIWQSNEVNGSTFTVGDYS